MIKKQVILVDFDGVLSTGEAWTPEDCEKAEPIEENIKKVNELAKYNFIVVYTARRDELIYASLKWLKRHGVEFDAISNNKTAANYYVDDKNTDLDTLKEV